MLGHLILLQAHCALADLAAADPHAAAADRLAERYDLPLGGVFTDWYAALRLAVTVIRTRRKPPTVPPRPPHGTGMPGMEEGLLPLALLSLRLRMPLGEASSRVKDPSIQHELRDVGEWESWNWGPHEPWTRPLLLLSAGRRNEAATALSTLPESPHDLLREARLCLTARAALTLGDHATMEYVYAQLLPAADELAGAGSGVLTLGPVAQHLGDLATALGHLDEAAAHYGRRGQHPSRRESDRR